VYGYRSEDVRQNCHYNAKKRPVYMTACLGIIYNPSQRDSKGAKIRDQIIFGGGEAAEQLRKQGDG
jgi:hypothetical protein